MFDAEPLNRARDAVANADALRRESPAEWYEEIPDPLGGSSRLAREVANDVQRLTISLLRGLFGSEAVAPAARRLPAAAALLAPSGGGAGSRGGGRGSAPAASAPDTRLPPTSADQRRSGSGRRARSCG